MRAALLSGVFLMTLVCRWCNALVADKRLSRPAFGPSPAQCVFAGIGLSMRDLDAELVSIRERLVAGEDISDARFTEHKFLELAPTDGSMLIEGFQAFTMAFERHVAEFNAAPDAAKYAAVVGGCEACHMRSCPGPLERIAKRHPSGRSLTQ